MNGLVKSAYYATLIAEDPANLERNKEIKSSICYSRALFDQMRRSFTGCLATRIRPNKPTMERESGLQRSIGYDAFRESLIFFCLQIRSLQLMEIFLDTLPPQQPLHHCLPQYCVWDEWVVQVRKQLWYVWLRADSFQWFSNVFVGPLPHMRILLLLVKFPFRQLWAILICRIAEQLLELKHSVGLLYK